MHKLVIVFLQSFTAPQTFTEGWQKFLGLAEGMPGLRKEVITDPDEVIFGPPNQKYRKVHELYFDSRADLDAALKSEAGQKAGQWLHAFTQGQFVLMISRHMEATPEEFKKPEGAQSASAEQEDPPPTESE
jgi:uncharacterized protein (TIGR02118 family)